MTVISPNQRPISVCLPGFRLLPSQRPLDRGNNSRGNSFMVWAPAQISSEAKWTIDRLLKFFFDFVSVFLFCGGLQQLCLAKFKHATWTRTCLKSPKFESRLHAEHIFRKVVWLNRRWHAFCWPADPPWTAGIKMLAQKRTNEILRKVWDIFITKFLRKLWLLMLTVSEVNWKPVT